MLRAWTFGLRHYTQECFRCQLQSQCRHLQAPCYVSSQESLGRRGSNSVNSHCQSERAAGRVVASDAFDSHEVALAGVAGLGVVSAGFVERRPQGPWWAVRRLPLRQLRWTLIRNTNSSSTPCPALSASYLDWQIDTGHLAEPSGLLGSVVTTDHQLFWLDSPAALRAWAKIGTSHWWRLAQQWLLPGNIRVTSWVVASRGASVALSTSAPR